MPRLTQTWRGPDKEYTLTELTHADWLTLTKYIQYREYHLLKRDAETIPELAELLPEVLKRCAQNKVDMNDVDRNMMQVDMVAEIVTLSLRHFHTAITRAEVLDLLSVSNQIELVTIIMGLSGFEAGKNDKDDGSKKATGDAP